MDRRSNRLPARAARRADAEASGNPRAAAPLHGSNPCDRPQRAQSVFQRDRQFICRGLYTNFTNNGIVIENSRRRILTAAKTGANFTLTARGYAGHTYQFQRADTLTGPARFYHVAVGP